MGNLLAVCAHERDDGMLARNESLANLLKTLERLKMPGDAACKVMSERWYDYSGALHKKAVEEFNTPNLYQKYLNAADGDTVSQHAAPSPPPPPQHHKMEFNETYDKSLSIRNFLDNVQLLDNNGDNIPRRILRALCQRCRVEGDLDVLYDFTTFLYGVMEDEEHVFWMLTTVVEQFRTTHFYESDRLYLYGFQIENRMLNKLVSRCFPRLVTEYCLPGVLEAVTGVVCCQLLRPFFFSTASSLSSTLFVLHVYFTLGENTSGEPALVGAFMTVLRHVIDEVANIRDGVVKARLDSYDLYHLVLDCARNLDTKTLAVGMLHPSNQFPANYVRQLQQEMRTEAEAYITSFTIGDGRCYFEGVVEVAQLRRFIGYWQDCVKAGESCANMEQVRDSLKVCQIDLPPSTVTAMWSLLDINESGVVDVRKMACVLACVVRAYMPVKLRLCFDCYDLENRQFIQRNDATNISATLAALSLFVGADAAVNISLVQKALISFDTKVACFVTKSDADLAFGEFFAAVVGEPLLLWGLNNPKDENLIISREAAKSSSSSTSSLTTTTTTTTTMGAVVVGPGGSGGGGSVDDDGGDDDGVSVDDDRNASSIVNDDDDDDDDAVVAAAAVPIIQQQEQQQQQQQQQNNHVIDDDNDDENTFHARKQQQQQPNDNKNNGSGGDGGTGKQEEVAEAADDVVQRRLKSPVKKRMGVDAMMSGDNVVSHRRTLPSDNMDE